MYLSKLLLLLFTTSILGKFIHHKAGYACQEPSSLSKYTPDCFVDLTVAIDMSLSMKSDSNIAKLADSILGDFMPSFNFKETYTAGLAFGALSIGASNYFNNYADICQYIHSAQEQAIQLGLGNANLSEVFETYQISLLNSGRNYKKVLVLLTSITDVKEIAAAKHYSDQLQASGVYIIVGVLGNASITLYSQLGNHVFSSPHFTLSVTNITENICQFGGITVTPAQSSTVHPTTAVPQTTHVKTSRPSIHPSTHPSTMPSTTTSSPPTTKKNPPTTKIPLPSSTASKISPPTPPHPTIISNHGIGTSCSKNVKNAWLDIALVFDVSAAITDGQLEQLIDETQTYILKFTLNQIGQHTTRVAIISYASDATITYSFNDNQSNQSFFDALQKLKNRTTPHNQIVNVQNALQVAFEHLLESSTYRPQVILLTAAAYQRKGFQGADHTAEQIKLNEITIFTVNFNAADGVLNGHLSGLASPGYAYNSSDVGLAEDLPLSLTQVNCFCPGSRVQFKIFNSISKRYTKYADCISGYAGETLPSIISKYGCDSGILAAITSEEKLDFVIKNILEHELFGKNQFTVGGHKIGNNEWVWSGYNGTFPFEDFPPFTEVSPSDKYTFFNILPESTNGFTFKSTGDVARPYLCESRACDADYICDQSVEKKIFKKY
uniref:VWFA domain-containing protein n=1 Tax=Panagrolaimus superbus TaxID=310955 RepID=A0A914YP95_9BILA